MELEKYSSVGNFIKESFNGERKMVKENISFKMVTFTKVIGKMIREREKEFIHGKMVIIM